MAAGQFGRIGLRTGGAADALDFVGGEGNANARATQKDTAVAFAAGNGAGSAGGINGIMAAFRGISAEILILEMHFFQERNNFLFHIQSAVVIGDGNHDEIPRFL